MKNMKNMKKVDIIGIQMDLGASKRGVNMGPAAIRHADIFAKLDDMGIDWRDKGDIIPQMDGESKPGLKHCGQIVEANARLYSEVLESLKGGRMPIVLGGDHSVAAGSVPAAVRHLGAVGVIWIDAHGDFNNRQSSPSGNMHGMPFSAVCGCGPEEMMPYGPYFADPRHAVQIGARDVDAVERQRLREAGVTVFSITEIDRMGLAHVVSRAIEIAGAGTQGIHVSFDIDAVTPDEAPGVGTPVHSGLTVREAFLAMEMLYECRQVCSMDMVEVNPILDIQNKTGNLACELILSLLGKTVF
ncbi:MAG: arginase [Clostridiales Family XIII bacterium]|jgi:arginase|nr:arginase [Clostridiales Family XIII bacterium]